MEEEGEGVDVQSGGAAAPPFTPPRPSAPARPMLALRPKDARKCLAEERKRELLKAMPRAAGEGSGELLPSAAAAPMPAPAPPHAPPTRLSELYLARRLTLRLIALFEYMALCVEEDGVGSAGMERSSYPSSSSSSSSASVAAPTSPVCSVRLSRAAAHVGKLLYAASFVLDAAALQLSAALEAFPVPPSSPPPPPSSSSSSSSFS